ncbi:vitamin K epoxide reductase family protein [Patescibacteria group bacterium]|nr:vitamin K epoxide reductase family protein [Patescibacteria group bacterium]MBU1703068.1 vitamin K epoxide reductase family protein [Patescibacteria group bacterium]MBU1954161.1 vitamin K epoxide reductase family protein [Patescibacteria group bacterium]
MVRQKVNKLLTAIAALCFVAMGVTIYLTYMHFKPEAAEFCNFSEAWNCDVVNKSAWSVVDLGFVQIPVAILGFLTYLTFFVVSILIVKKVNWRKIWGRLNEKLILNLMKYLSIIGFVFSLYLSYIEAFVLQTFCLFCVIQQVIILAIMILFFVILAAIKSDMNKTRACEFC